MDPINVTLIPAFRISSCVKPEIRIYSSETVQLILHVIQYGQEVMEFKYDLNNKNINRIFPSFEGITGKVELIFDFFNQNEVLIASRKYNYEIIDSQCNSTTLIDGCWISLYHWSDDEARWFNSDLKNLTDEDWKQKIYDMNNIGIKGVIIQNLFHCNEYVAQHNMSTNDYKGMAFYPSKIFPDRYPITAEDPVEAILSAADECDMNVFLGVGLYAWFDFSNESLKWHKKVTEELFNMYGYHQSLYGWYVSEEIFGSLYYDYPFIENEAYKDIIKFFKEYREFINKLTPTKPVALAPNNIRFHEFEKEWKEILVNIDILIPFAFARDPENLNINQITQICNESGTHLWVDMEMFAWPLDNGLIPKTHDNLIKEIRMYDNVEQIYGYQYTGIMNSRNFKYSLGGEKTRQLYDEYYKYYKEITERK